MVVNGLALLLVVVTTTADLALTLSMVAALALGFALIVSLGINESLTDSEVSLNFGLGWNRSCHPRVLVDLLDGRSLSRVEGHHLLEEVLEFRSINVLT